MFVTRRAQSLGNTHLLGQLSHPSSSLFHISSAALRHRHARAFEGAIASAPLPLSLAPTSYKPSVRTFSASRFFKRSFRTPHSLKMGSVSQVDQPTNNNHFVQPVERIAEELERPELDNRTYRVIKLENELEALLIHDPDTDKVSGALDVNVGSFSDADDMPGIAHAVEHLLFMGTEKYPKENAYNQYLTAHSGYSNAFTASTSTNYYFEVAASSKPSSSKSSAASSETDVSTKAESPLYGALDRFAQFFVAPLFLEDTLDRELRAVDSENKKNLQSDNWRLHQLNKTLSNPEHPFCHFSTGSYKTLHDEPLARGVRIRDEFMKFYETHYSANRMKLVVLGRESLDELESWVVELFSPIKNKNYPRNRWDDVPTYTENELGMQIFAKPVFDMRNLDLYFPYPDEEELYESMPGRYLSHLIGHEGPGSILAYIKAKGWANGLGAGPMPLCPGSAFFSISIRLTEDGLKNYKEVVKVIFQYIAMMRDAPPQEWIFEELKQMSEVDFRFRQKSPASKTASSLSGVMQKPYPRKWLLSGPSLFRKFNPEAIKKGLSYLRPDNFRLTIVSQDFPGDWDKKEKWYGTEYKYERIPEDFLAELKKAAQSSPDSRPAELYLPHKNEFIPSRLDVDKKEVEEPLKAPKLIRNDENIRTWWKKDDRFWVPKANVHITLRTPLVNSTPQTTVMAQVYSELVKDALVEYSYAAEIAGLEYSISHHSLGFDISVSGYNEKMPVLLEKVLVSMRDLEVLEERFDIIKERLLRGFRNWDFQQPFHQVGTYSRWLHSEKGWISEQYLAELPHIVAADIRDFFPQLLRQAHIEVMAHGNLYKEDALKVADLVESTLHPRKLPPAQWPIRRSLMLPRSCDYVYNRTLKDPANVNHCIEYLLYVGSNADRELRAKLLLTAQVTDEPAFDQLRTKEQLGYVVFSGASIHSMWAGYRVLIQSEKTPEYLDGRIESFLTQFEKTLDEMDEEHFEKHKRSLINKRLEKLKNLDQESTRFYNHIASERFDFLQLEHDVAHIEPITLEDLRAFYKTYISPASPTRAKLSVRLHAQSSPAVIAAGTTPLEQISKLTTLLTQFLNSQGVTVDSEKLSTRFESLDLAKGAEGVTEATVAYLTQDLGLPADKVAPVLEEGKKMMGTVLAGIGIEKEDMTKAKEVNGEVEAAQEKQQPTVVEDVHAWKAGLEVSKGASPVCDLSEFEELDAKL